MLKSIEEEWNGYSIMIFRKMALSVTQLKETRRAFYAGAWAMFCGAQECGSDSITDEQALEWLEFRRRECEVFKKDLLAKYAEGN